MILCNNRPIRVPAVGQEMFAHPYFGIDNVDGKIPCVVVSVNEKHGHFTVRFPGGYREAFRFEAKEASY